MDRKFDVVNVYLFILVKKRCNLVMMFDKLSILFCVVVICLIFGEIGVVVLDMKVKKMRKGKCGNFRLERILSFIYYGEMQVVIERRI